MKLFLKTVILLATFGLAGNAAQAQIAAGTYPIGSGTYTTLAAAIAALNTQGVSGAVIFTIPAGYTETAPTSGFQLGSATLNASLSATNTLTFQKSGAGTNPLLTAYTNGSGTPASAIQDGIWSLRGADYVTIDGINLTDPNTSNPATMEYGYALYKASATDGCQNVTIKNCTITLNRINNDAGAGPMYQGSNGIIVMNATATAANAYLTPTAASGNNSNNKFYSNTIQNCNNAIAMTGFAATSPYTIADQNNDIGGTAATGNTFLNFGGAPAAVNPASAVFLKDMYGFNVSYNTINNNNGSGLSHPTVLRGIWVNASANGASGTIANNTVTIISGGSSTQVSVIECAAGSSGSGNTININNNAITNCTNDLNTTGIWYGIWNSGAPANLNITGNTFTNNTNKVTSAATYLIYNSGAVSGNINLNNNNLSQTFNGTSAYTTTFYGIYNSGGTTTSVASISNNTFSNYLHTIATGTGTIYYIYNTNSNAALTINANNWNNLALNSSGAHYLIYNSGSTQVGLNVTNNTIGTAYTRTATAGTMYCYYSPAASSGTSTQTISGNNFSNITATLAGTGTFYGIYNNDGGTAPYPRKSIFGNKISNINYPSTGTFYGFYTSFLGDGTSSAGSTVYNDTLSNIVFSGVMYGIYTTATASPNQPYTVHNNLISGITNNSLTAFTYAMYNTGAPAGASFYANNLNNLQSAVVNSGIIYGMYFSGSTNSSVYNNTISDMRTPAGNNLSPVFGMYFGAGTQYNVYYNTIYLNPASTGANFGATGIFYGSTINTFDLRNNIVNVAALPAGGGFVTALRRSAGTAGLPPANLTTTSNSNIYYVPNVANAFLYGEGASVPLANAYSLTNDPSFNTPCGLYKAFMTPRESSAFTENNLTQIGSTATYTPTGQSYAKNNAVATTNPAVTVDYNNITRPNPADVGALQFTGTGTDAAGPTISYTALPPTTYCTANPTLAATITDATGVNTTTGTAPRVYFKKSTENNAFGGVNNSTFNGWKWVEATSTGSSFAFTLNYALLTGPIAVNDSITYFIVAQDLLPMPNVSSVIAAFPAGYCPASVALAAAAGPLLAAPASYGYRIQAVPAITVSALQNQLCISGSTTLTLSATTNGLSIQWQQDNGTGTFTDIAGATGTSYTTPTLTSTNSYRVRLSCGGSTIYTTAAQAITVNNPGITGTIPGTRCGIGTVTLGATGSAGSTLNWYTAATGGTSVATGASFTTPVINATTPYYVSATSGTGSSNVGKVNTNGVDGYNTGTASYLIFDAISAFTLQSVVIYPYSAAAGTAGTATIAIQNSAGVTLQSVTVNVTGYPTPIAQTVPVNLNVLPGTNLRMIFTAFTGVTGFYRDYTSTSGIALPYTLPGVVSITNGSTAGYYFYFYNWTVTTACESARTAVVATVIPPPAVIASSPNFPGICSGGTAVINATSANTGYSYSWTPSATLSCATCATSNATPAATTTYIVTATDNSGGAGNGCVAKDSVKLFVNAQPAPPTITPATSTICQGGQVMLTANTGNSVSGANWQNITGLYKNTTLTQALTATDTNKVVYASPSGTQLYTVVANLQGCVSNPSTSATVNVNPAPNTAITPGPTAAICTGQAATLTAVQTGTGYTYQWYNGSTLIAGATGNTFTTGTAGTYKVMVTNTTTGCSATTATGTTVVINPPPTATATAQGPVTFCNGGTVQIDANTGAGFTYQWLNNNVPVTGQTGQSFSAAATGNYAVIVTNANGCFAASNAVAVTVNTTPATNTPQGPTTFCTGSSVVLQANTGANLTYVWQLNGSPIAGQTGSSYTATSSGNYTVIVTNTATGCASTSPPVTIIIGAPPVATVTPAGSIAICDGSSLTLSTNAAPGLAYQWYKNGTAILGANGQTYTQVFTSTSGGSYTVSVSSGVGCSSTSAATIVTINPLPVVTIGASGATTFCQGNNTVLTATAATGITYQWYNGATAITGATASTYTASATGSYTVRGTNSNGCVGVSNAVSVTVNPLPTVVAAAAGATTFCQGGSVVLNVTPSTGLSYQWNVNTTPIVGAVTSSYTATVSGNYTVTVTNGSGCTNTTNAITVTVNPLPNVTTTPAGTINICAGTTTTISIPAGTSQTYQWMSGGVNIGGATTNTYTTGAAGIYTVKATNTVTGCFAISAPDTVIVNPLPAATATAQGPATICQGDTTILTANTGTGYSYQWRLNGNNIAGATGQTYGATTAGTYTVQVINSVGCSAVSNGITITVNPSPSAFITYNSPLSFCQGGAVVLNGNPGAGLTYQWLLNGVLISNTGASNVSSQPGNYTIKVTNSFGCTATSAPVTVTVWQLPTPLITMNGGVLSTGSYTTYQWYLNNQPIPGAIAQTYVPTANGYYKVVVKDAHQCTAASDQFSVSGLGITAAPGVRDAIKIFPNPATAILHVDAPVKVNLSLRDVSGKVVMVKDGVKELDITNLAAGLYLLYISDTEGHLLKAEKVAKTAN